MYELEDLLLEYATRSNPKSDDDLKRYLRRYPQFCEEIIQFTANWRVLSILDHVLSLERQFVRDARAQLIHGARQCRNGPAA